MLVTPKMAGRGKAIDALIHAAESNYLRTYLGMKRGLREAAELLLKESRRVVPIDTGALHDTSRVVTGGRGYKRAYALVQYRMFYAIYVHEDLTMRHAPGKTAKFLEWPARRFRRQMAAIIRRRSEKK